MRKIWQVYLYRETLQAFEMKRINKVSKTCISYNGKQKQMQLLGPKITTTSGSLIFQIYLPQNLSLNKHITKLSIFFSDDSQQTGLFGLS